MNNSAVDHIHRARLLTDERDETNKNNCVVLKKR